MFSIEPIHHVCRVADLAGNEPLILFSGKEMLMARDADGALRLPLASHMASYLPENEELILSGKLDDVPCYGMEMTLNGTSLPQDVVSMQIRNVFSQNTLDIMNAISRCCELYPWWRRHRLCGRCGAELAFSQSDMARVCPHCGERYYPQLAPAVIIAISRNDGQELLLAHNRRAPDGIFGLIAGFVEAGETVEQAVEREIQEETGLRVKNIHYLSSQPWPFPNSLMLAFRADYASGSPCPDGNELTELGWFSKDTLPKTPPPGSIAYDVIRRFFA